MKNTALSPYPPLLRRLRLALAIFSSLLAFPGIYGAVLLSMAFEEDDLALKLVVCTAYVFMGLGFVLLFGYWHLPKFLKSRGRAVFWFCSAGYNFILTAVYAVPAWMAFRSMGVTRMDFAQMTMMLGVCYVGAVGCLGVALGRADLAALNRQREEQNLQEALAGTAG